MATNNTAIIGTLAIVTNAPRSTARPPRSSISIALAQIGSNLRMWNLAILANMRIAKMGIVLLILLPVLCILLMLLVFIRERDFRFASIAGLVLAIIFLAIVLGLPATSALAG